MATNAHHRILLADDNPIFREALADRFRADGYDVVAAATGEQAFLALRDRSRPVGWLYARAALPGLIDGWILADEYRAAYPDRAAVIAAADARAQAEGRIALVQPDPATVFKAMKHAIDAAIGRQDGCGEDRGDRRAA